MRDPTISRGSTSLSRLEWFTTPHLGSFDARTARLTQPHVHASIVRSHALRRRRTSPAKTSGRSRHRRPRIVAARSPPASVDSRRGVEHPTSSPATRSIESMLTDGVHAKFAPLVPIVPSVRQPDTRRGGQSEDGERNRVEKLQPEISCYNRDALSRGFKQKPASVALASPVQAVQPHRQ